MGCFGFLGNTWCPVIPDTKHTLLQYPETNSVPPITRDLESACRHLYETGMCVVADVLTPEQTKAIGEKLEEQAASERALGDLAPKGMVGCKQYVPNMVNKGKSFLDLVEKDETDHLVGCLLGDNFLLSSVNGHIYTGANSEPELLHRDQGQVPASISMPVVCNLLWALDDFTPEGGGTLVVPGSHRWEWQHQIRPPDMDIAEPVTVPAGGVLVLDGRVWHAGGVNKTGSKRRSIATFFCAPWIRQQENAALSCFQEVLDEASPKLRARLGMHTYGTMGTVGGTGSEVPGATLISGEFSFPKYIIGESGSLHPLPRVSRQTRI